MGDQGSPDRIVRFGEFEIDRQACELRQAGKRVPLQIQPFRVLEILVDHAGEVVTRAELGSKIWPSTVYVDFDHGLDNAMTRIRRALDDSADAPKYIETRPRLGFRFIYPLDAPVSEPTWGKAAQTLRAAAPWIGMAMVFAVLVGMLIINLPRSPRIDNVPDQSSLVVDRPTESAEAYESYLRGVELFEQRSKESVNLSIENLTRAVELDGNFAVAYAALAMAYTAAGGSTLVKFRSADEVRGAALAAVERALQIDPGLAQAHVALAGVLNQLQPWSAANDVAIENSFLRALEIDPEDANAHLFFGNFLSSRGRSQEAVFQFEKALGQVPLSPSVNSRLGMELVTLGNIDEGLEYLRKTTELDPWQFNARVRLGWAYIANGDFDAGGREFETAERISPASARSRAGLALIAARSGDRARARALLATMLPLARDLDDPFDIAIVYVSLGDRENSIEWLARTVRQTQSLRLIGPWGTQAPMFDWLRDDPRFAQIESEIATKMKPGHAVE